mmetsp:Transcript_12293/g.24888  ORF Transcript_12293/g.24888 Transcript_12293/m.24888 type:complete len:97 (-) Transcript_12293:299-589(-)
MGLSETANSRSDERRSKGTTTTIGFFQKRDVAPHRVHCNEWRMIRGRRVCRILQYYFMVALLGFRCGKTVRLVLLIFFFFTNARGHPPNTLTGHLI